MPRPLLTIGSLLPRRRGSAARMCRSRRRAGATVAAVVGLLAMVVPLTGGAEGFLFRPPTLVGASQSVAATVVSHTAVHATVKAAAPTRTGGEPALTESDVAGNAAEEDAGAWGAAGFLVLGVAAAIGFLLLRQRSQPARQPDVIRTGRFLSPSG